MNYNDEECRGCANNHRCAIVYYGAHECPCKHCLVKAMCNQQCSERLQFYDNFRERGGGMS